MYNFSNQTFPINTNPAIPNVGITFPPVMVGIGYPQQQASLNFDASLLANSNTGFALEQVFPNGIPGYSFSNSSSINCGVTLPGGVPIYPPLQQSMLSQTANINVDSGITYPLLGGAMPVLIDGSIKSSDSEYFVKEILIQSGGIAIKPTGCISKIEGDPLSYQSYTDKTAAAIMEFFEVGIWQHPDTFSKRKLIEAVCNIDFTPKSMGFFHKSQLESECGLVVQDIQDECSPQYMIACVKNAVMNRMHLQNKIIVPVTIITFMSWYHHQVAKNIDWPRFLVDLFTVPHIALDTVFSKLFNEAYRDPIYELIKGINRNIEIGSQLMWRQV